jgi:hypothetical protein
MKYVSGSGGTIIALALFAGAANGYAQQVDIVPGHVYQIKAVSSLPPSNKCQSYQDAMWYAGYCFVVYDLKEASVSNVDATRIPPAYGRAYTVFATASPPGRPDCNQMQDDMWYNHYCFTVLKAEELTLP